MDSVYFTCVKEGSKLRVRITSRGYNTEANCQFPRNIRKEGAVYVAPSSAVTFARGPAGKFFYRVSKNLITQLSSGDKTEEKVTVEKVYEDESTECIVCMDKCHEVVIVPCGHFCLCQECANQIIKTTGKCPICRGKTSLLVTRDQIQI